MTFDYDLVVIGGTPEGQYAAQVARSYGARVALVRPTNTEGSHQGDRVWEPAALGEVGRSLHDTRQGYGRWIGGDPSSLRPQWEHIQQWGRFTVEAAVLSLESCKTSIDVITDRAYFTPHSSITLMVGDRPLRSRAYLLATGTRWVLPAMDGMAMDDMAALLTPDHLWACERDLTALGQLVVVGETPTALALAQTLQRLGNQVTLALPGDRLLPGEDREIAALLLALLEAEGVRVLTQAPLNHLRWIDQQLWVQLGTQALEADHVLVAQARQPQVEGLHLDQIGVRVRPWGVPVNQHLQTCHSRLYACGDVLGGYSATTIGRHEAAIAVRNALFYPGWRVHYATIPWPLLTDPVVAHIGWTEQQAYQRYGADVVVLKHLPSPSSAQGSSIGLCKLVATPQGRLLGGQILGPQAEAGISAIALAMQQGIPVQKLAHWPVVEASGCDWVQQAAAQWPHGRSHPFWQHLLEEWLNGRRG